jgi:AraC-like DNA-binding protein
MNRTPAAKARGVLKSPAIPKLGKHARIRPETDLQPFIEHFWLVEWDLTGQPSHVAQTLPHPSVHLTVEPDGAFVGGVNTGKFSRELSGRGRVFGIKFRPAMFYPFCLRPLAELTNRIEPVTELFGAAGADYAAAIAAEPDENRCVIIAEAFLRERLPARDALAEQIRDAVELVAQDHSLIRVEQIAELLQTNPRNLQRFFRKYIGVTPKWVIQRYRLHEAAEQLNEKPNTNLTELALQLGYFDQAHFVRDFKSVIGVTPGHYAQS